MTKQEKEQYFLELLTYDVNKHSPFILQDQYYLRYFSEEECVKFLEKNKFKFEKRKGYITINGYS